jgi:hypothetical protein
MMRNHGTQELPVPNNRLLLNEHEQQEPHQGAAGNDVGALNYFVASGMER